VVSDRMGRSARVGQDDGATWGTTPTVIFEPEASTMLYEANAQATAENSSACTLRIAALQCLLFKPPPA
jgi:hypothetical protein